VSTCNHCGATIPEGMLSCQSCGTPLTPGGPGASQLRTAQLVDEDALPAWLRNMPVEGEPDASAYSSFPSLGLRAAVPASPEPAPAGTPGAHLPEWLRLVQPADDHGPPAQSSAASVAPNSLIEEDALPEWLRASASLASAVSQALSNSLPGIAESMPAASSFIPQAPAVNADTLIDTAAIPDWVRQATMTPAPQANPIFGSIPVSPLPPATPSAHRSAPVDAPSSEGEELPQWLRRVYEDAHVPTWTAPNELTQPAAQDTPVAANQTSGTGPLSLNSLIDTTNLPEWLQQGSDAPPPAAAGMAQAPGERLSAASLIEQASFPSWLQAEHEQPAQPTGAPPSTSAAPSTPAPLAAGDLIERAALPSWMLSAETAHIPTTATPPAAQSAPTPSSPEAAPDWFQQLSSSPAPTMGNIPAAPSVRHGADISIPAATSLPQARDMRPPEAPRQSHPAAESAPRDVSSLVEPERIPPWMRSSPAASLPPMPAMTAPMSATSPAAQPSPAQPAELSRDSAPTNQQQHISVTSLFDTDALPDWLRGPADAAPGVNQPAHLPPQQIEVDTGQLRAASVFAAVAGPTPVTSPVEPWNMGTEAPAHGPAQPPPNAPYSPAQSAPRVPYPSQPGVKAGNQSSPGWWPGQQPAQPYPQGNPPFPNTSWPGPNGYPGNAGPRPAGNAPYAIGGTPVHPGQQRAPTAPPGNAGTGSAPSQLPALVRKRGFWSRLRALFRFRK
jgi:hypothetical protein